MNRRILDKSIAASAAALAVVLAVAPAAAARRDDCHFNATNFNPMKYSTPNCTFDRHQSISQMNACYTEIVAMGKLVDESWSRAYAAAKAATEQCLLPFKQQDAIDRAQEKATAALNGSLASDMSAYLAGTGSPTNRAAIERVQSVAKLIGEIQNDAFGVVSADVNRFAANPAASINPIRSGGVWSVVAHPPTAAALAADRNNWAQSRREIAVRQEATRQQAAQLAAQQAAAQQREEAVTAASSDDDDSASDTNAAMMQMMGSMMGSMSSTYATRPSPSYVPSRAAPAQSNATGGSPACPHYVHASC